MHLFYHDGKEDGVVVVYPTEQPIEPFHYMIALDCSSSMSEPMRHLESQSKIDTRFQVSLQALRMLVDSLRECDVVTIIGFHHEVCLLYDHVKPKDIDWQELATHALDGMTDLYSVFTYMSVRSQLYQEKWIEIVLTDGIPTCGPIRDPRKLAIYKTLLCKPSVSWIGVIGDKAFWELARDLANVGSLWSYIDSVDHLKEEMRIITQVATKSCEIVMDEITERVFFNQPNFIYVNNQPSTINNEQAKLMKVKNTAWCELMRAWHETLMTHSKPRLGNADTPHEFRKEYIALRNTLERRLKAMNDATASYRPDVRLDLRRYFTERK